MASSSYSNSYSNSDFNSNSNSNSLNSPEQRKVPKIDRYETFRFESEHPFEQMRPIDLLYIGTLLVLTPLVVPNVFLIFLVAMLWYLGAIHTYHKNILDELETRSGRGKHWNYTVRRRDKFSFEVEVVWPLTSDKEAPNTRLYRFDHLSLPNNNSFYQKK